MKKISVSFYKGGKEIIGVTNGHTVFCTENGKDKELVLSNFYINWMQEDTVEQAIINPMEKYLKALIEEKGKALDDEIVLDGHIGLTYAMLVDFIVSIPSYHEEIRKTLVMIDFSAGDVFHYLDYLAQGMVAALGLDFCLTA